MDVLPTSRSGPEPPQARTSPFADLRRHNAYAAQVARLLEARRERRIEQVIRMQRKHRFHQAR
ncbi:MAG: hypothetical protein JO244_08525 [Solirubrobacterales bacterium]|nr:hypothetical protein [Solirubrobacterales bacterium]